MRDVLEQFDTLNGEGTALFRIRDMIELKDPVIPSIVHVRSRNSTQVHLVDIGFWGHGPIREEHGLREKSNR